MRISCMHLLKIHSYLGSGTYEWMDEQRHVHTIMCSLHILSERNTEKVSMMYNIPFVS
jgi:hypothetical protein